MRPERHVNTRLKFTNKERETEFIKVDAEKYTPDTQEVVRFI